MQVAILIHGDRFRRAGADDRLGLVAQIDADTAIFGLDVDERDVVLGQHRMRRTTHLDLDRAVVDAGNNGQMLLDARLDGIRYELLHLLATTNNRDFRINDFLDHIAAMAALIKLGCHKSTMYFKVCFLSHSVEHLAELRALHRAQTGLRQSLGRNKEQCRN